MNEKQKMKQEKEMMRQGQEIFEQVSEGKSTREILIEIYLDAFPEKTVRQAGAVADKVMAAIAKFDRDYAMAQKNLDIFLDDALDRMGNGMNRTERCILWLKLAATIDEMEESKNGAVSEEKMASYIRRITVMDSEATAEFEERTRQDAKKALLKSGLVVSGMLRSADELQEISESDEAASLLVDLGTAELEYRAIVTMLIYTKVRNGEIDDIPQEISAEELTTQVCAEIETIRIAEAVENGTIQKSTGRALIEILGYVILIAASIFCIIMDPTDIQSLRRRIGLSESAPQPNEAKTLNEKLMTCGWVLVVTEAFSKAAKVWHDKIDDFVDAVLAIPSKVANGLFKLVSPESRADADSMEKMRESADGYTPLYEERISAMAEESPYEEVEEDEVFEDNNNLYV